jgi:serine/threonine-protein kinase
MVCVYGGIPDFLKVLDFGLVKDIGSVEAPLSVAAGATGLASESDAALSQDGSLLGTPLYMAPEGMTDPTKLDVRADLFALGAVGYYLLTGSSPFPGRTAIEVFKKERQGPPRPLGVAARHPVPPVLERAILDCLAFRREDRPASAEALDAVLEGCAVEPAWTRADARNWWRERGPAALEAARAERREGGRMLVVAGSEDSSGD